MIYYYALSLDDTYIPRTELLLSKFLTVLVTNTKDHDIWQHSIASQEDVAFIESKLS